MSFRGDLGTDLAVVDEIEVLGGILKQLIGLDLCRW